MQRFNSLCSVLPPYGLVFGVFQLEKVKYHHDLSRQLVGHLIVVSFVANRNSGKTCALWPKPGLSTALLSRRLTPFMLPYSGRSHIACLFATSLSLVNLSTCLLARVRSTFSVPQVSASNEGYDTIRYHEAHENA